MEIKDKECNNCIRMTVSQDEYISNLEEQIKDLEKEIEELKNQIEKQKSINKDYVDEVYQYQKELEECDSEYKSLIDYLDETNPKILQDYAIKRLTSKGATVIKLGGGNAES